MIRVLLVCALLAGCADVRGIVVSSETEPVRLEGNAGERSCSVTVELGGHVYTFESTLGCYVVRTMVEVPRYHVEGAGRP